MHSLIESTDGMTASTATADNVNTSVQQMITMIQSATNDLGSASGTGSGNPLQLVGTTISVCIGLTT